MAIMLLIVDYLQCCILVKMERFIFKSYTLIPNIIFSYPFLKMRIEFLNSDASFHCSFPRTQSTSQRAWASSCLLPCWHMTFVSSEVSKVCWSRLSKKQIPRPKMGLSVQEFYKGTCRFDLSANVFPVEEKGKKWSDESISYRPAVCVGLYKAKAFGLPPQAKVGSESRPMSPRTHSVPLWPHTP